MFKWKKKSVQAVTKVKQGKPVRIQNIDHIKKWEGLRLNAYLPTPNDKWTIGYGHTKTAHKGMVITEARAEELLRQDIAWVEAAILKLVLVPLTQNQFDALGGLIYNIGEGAFSRSTVLKRLNAKDYQGAAEAFMMWTKQRDKKTGKMSILQGLVNRRKDEMELFLK
jgi:lysozyme